jgi:hypothetical protein
MGRIKKLYIEGYVCQQNSSILRTMEGHKLHNSGLEKGIIKCICYELSHQFGAIQ